jgi:hypothetical protein
MEVEPGFNELTEVHNCGLGIPFPDSRGLGTPSVCLRSCYKKET